MVKTYELNRVSKRAAARVLGIAGAVFGFLYGLAVSVTVVYLVGTGATLYTALRGMEGAIGLAAIVTFPLVFGILGACTGAILAAFYNFVAKHSGGLRFDFKPYEEKTSVPPRPQKPEKQKQKGKK